VDPKRIIGNKMEGKGGEAQGVTGQKNEFALGQKNGQIAKSRDSTVTLFEFFSCESRHLQMTASRRKCLRRSWVRIPPPQIKNNEESNLVSIAFYWRIGHLQKKSNCLVKKKCEQNNIT
jgi:hypothetical protein